MPCFKPLKGFRSPSGALVFGRQQSIGLGMSVPCGQCVGCRLERSRQWAVRCMHEASLHEDNCFLTLTYSDENLPEYGSLVKSDFQKFVKRMRKRFAFRYFHCGEYGEETKRPHYHALLFGFDFPDKVPWRESKGYKIWRSPILEEMWSQGNSEIGTASFESAAYVARYCVKTLQNLRFRQGDRDSYVEALDREYSRVDEETGEIVIVAPEYTTMSRRPGIGSRWFEKFGTEVYPSDEVLVRGRSCKPPRFYDELQRREDAVCFEGVRRARSLARRLEDQTPERLRVREVCAEARLSLSGGRGL